MMLFQSLYWSQAGCLAPSPTWVEEYNIHLQQPNSATFPKAGASSRISLDKDLAVAGQSLKIWNICVMNFSCLLVLVQRYETQTLRKEWGRKVTSKPAWRTLPPCSLKNSANPLAPQNDCFFFQLGNMKKGGTKQAKSTRLVEDLLIQSTKANIFVFHTYFNWCRNKSPFSSIFNSMRRLVFHMSFD